MPRQSNRTISGAKGSSFQPIESERTLELVEDYLDAVARLKTELEESLGVPNLLEGRRRNEIPREGKFGDGGEFFFHGIGCRIQTTALKVDFDFCPDGEVDGFDAWRLHLFAESNEFGEVWQGLSERKLQESLDRMEEAGVIVRLNDSSLYRLTGGAPHREKET